MSGNDDPRQPVPLRDLGYELRYALEECAAALHSLVEAARASVRQENERTERERSAREDDYQRWRAARVAGQRPGGGDR